MNVFDYVFNFSKQFLMQLTRLEIMTSLTEYLNILRATGLPGPVKKQQYYSIRKWAKVIGSLCSVAVGIISGVNLRTKRYAISHDYR